MLGEMQTRDELYRLIGLNDFEALDASIVQSLVPPTVVTRQARLR
jgi:methylisocitrate lyase